ncbi:Rv1733c family protein [Streptomyces sp. NBC_00343]|uniref:Rv1733c family protein n=1 Tax=unclassified Streptomyces TaxID=2593676 RepID=UPI003FA68312
MRTRVRSRRRRQNPLRRRSDVVEAWTALAVTLLLFVGAPLAGAAAGLWAHDQARTIAATQRADRHRVQARVIGNPPAQLPSVEGDRPRSFPVAVRWTEPGKGARTATVAVPADTGHGDVVAVWLDAKGHSVAPPPGEVAVWQHTVTVGVWSAAGVIGLALLARAVTRRVSLRHRLAEWERDWALTEPQWTRRRA